MLLSAQLGHTPTRKIDLHNHLPFLNGTLFHPHLVDGYGGSAIAPPPMLQHSLLGPYGSQMLLHVACQARRQNYHIPS